MMTVNPNAFVGRTEPPEDADLARALGPAQALWDLLLARLTTELDVTGREWHSYSPKAGWSLRVKKGSRTILWLSPRVGAMQAAFILGDRAVEAVRASGLPGGIEDALAAAKRYPEGTGLRLEIHKPDDLDPVMALAAIKIGH